MIDEQRKRNNRRLGLILASVALVFFPIYMVTGKPPIGLASDILFVASWVLNIAFAEVVIRHSSRPQPKVPK